jgi:hypothetical protein
MTDDTDELGDFEDETSFGDESETQEDEDASDDVGGEKDVPHSFEDVVDETHECEIGVGDTVLDLAQGRTMQVIEEHDQTSREWSDENDYELTENYANDRLGATDDDLVFECVYAGSVKNEPSKPYAFPESRLARIETEKADDGRKVRERIAVDVLESVFDSMLRYDALDEDDIDAVAKHVGDVSPEVVDEARELARANEIGESEDDT